MCHIPPFSLILRKKSFWVGFGNITYLNSELYFASDLHKNENLTQLVNYWVQQRREGLIQFHNIMHLFLCLPMQKGYLNF